MPKPAAGYSVSYNPAADTWAVYEGNKRIAVKKTEPDAWRYLQHLAVMEQRKAEKPNLTSGDVRKVGHKKRRPPAKEAARALPGRKSTRTRALD
jgi:hypothetical protein